MRLIRAENFEQPLLQIALSLRRGIIDSSPD